MKTFLSLLILTLIFGNYAKGQNIQKQRKKITATKTKKQIGPVFKHIADYPKIKDSIQFISDLRETFKLYVSGTAEQKEKEKITTYKKVKIYGSKKEFILIEYDYVDGYSADYPWKYLIILSKEGKLIEYIPEQSFELVKIFPNKNPFLMTVFSSAQGNGGHEFYKISENTLKHVYKGFYDGGIKTYSSNNNYPNYQPHKLNIKITDENKDGFNDIIFMGELIIPAMGDEDEKKFLVEFIFLYNKKTGYFDAKENYKEKYKKYRLSAD
jgi:hypothetical protein